MRPIQNPTPPQLQGRDDIGQSSLTIFPFRIVGFFQLEVAKVNVRTPVRDATECDNSWRMRSLESLVERSRQRQMPEEIPPELDFRSVFGFGGKWHLKRR